MNKALNTIGICKGARKLAYGEMLLEAIRNHKVSLVVICLDTSDNSKKKLIDKCKYYNCKYVFAFSKEELARAINRVDPVSGVGILDSNLAKKFLMNLKESEGDING